MYSNGDYIIKRKHYDNLNLIYENNPKIMKDLIDEMDKDIQNQIEVSKQLLTKHKTIVDNFVAKFSSDENVEEVLQQYFEPSHILSFIDDNMYNNIIYSLKFNNLENSDIIVSKSIYHNALNKKHSLGVLHTKRWQNEHEILAGLIINKTIGKFIPNFIITCGFRKAGPLFTLDNTIGISPHEITNNSGTSEYYLYTELIKAKTLSKILPFITLDEFLNIWYQILYALEIAQYHNDFTHYDFHLGNILIEELQDEFILPYYRPNKDIHYIKTKYLVRIIDYGFSYITYKGVAYGYNDPELHEFNRKAVFHPFQDIYTLINSIALHYITNKLLLHPIYRACEYWMRFFNSKNLLSNIVELQKSSYFPFYMKAEEISLTMSDFINYSQNKYVYSYNLTDNENLQDIEEEIGNYLLKNINKIKNVTTNYNNNELLLNYEKKADKIVFVNNLSELKLSMLYCNLYFDLLLIKDNIQLTAKLQYILDIKDEFLQHHYNLINKENNKVLYRKYKKEFSTYTHYCLLE
jgi:hypothetical protein